MAINPTQISVAKIYPGNYTNVLRYWHDSASVEFNNENGTNETYTNQPIGGPVGVIFRPGWIAQQAVGYVDMSYQALGTNNQLSYYAQAYSSGLNSSNTPFYGSASNVIIPSPDFHKDVRADITNGVIVPSGARVYRVGLRLSGGDIVSSGTGGADTTPTLGLGPALGVGLNTTPTASGFFAAITGSDSRIENGSFSSSDAWDSSTMAVVTTDTTYSLYTIQDLGGAAASGFAQGSGVYDPRASNNKLEGDNKALTICEVCWVIPDQPPERNDVALQPDGVTESSVYTSTTPS